MGDSGQVDLRSDTKTRPTPAMRVAIARADVGDEQYGEDPTVRLLEERVADLLGHEGAVFLPSGTMCNLVAACLHIGNAGDAILLARSAHMLRSEVGGAAVLCGAVFHPIDTTTGVFHGPDVTAAMELAGITVPRIRLVVVEQTSNWTGGRIWPSYVVADVVGTARANGVATHLDGARLLNAAVATGCAPRDIAGQFDTAWLDFSKGLGAPVGAVLVGPVESMARARRYKRMLGGALRQAGVLAAACTYALDHHVERLADDHARARALAEALADLPGFGTDPADVETNIVLAVVSDAPAVAAELAHHGVLVSIADSCTLRLVTHLDVDDAGIETAIGAARRVAMALR
jgi:threonine aldolase